MFIRLSCCLTKGFLNYCIWDVTGCEYKDFRRIGNISDSFFKVKICAGWVYRQYFKTGLTISVKMPLFSKIIGQQTGQYLKAGQGRF